MSGWAGSVGGPHIYCADERIPSDEADAVREVSVDHGHMTNRSVNVLVGALWYDVYPSGWLDGSDDRHGPHSYYLVRWQLSDYEVEQRGLEGGAA
tara:strand:+ start:703 stop:987 length:285 start_codon:yes stop_codon:yes gene_type:complete